MVLSLLSPGEKKPKEEKKDDPKKEEAASSEKDTKEGKEDKTESETKDPEPSDNVKVYTAYLLFIHFIMLYYIFILLML